MSLPIKKTTLCSNVEVLILNRYGWFGSGLRAPKTKRFDLFPVFTDKTGSLALTGLILP